MRDSTSIIEASKMLEMATLVQVGKSVVECLASETLCSSHKAQQLREPISSMCESLLAVKTDGDSEAIRRWVREVSKTLSEASDVVDEAVADGAASSSLVSKVRCRRGNSLFGVIRMGPVINRLCQKLSRLKQEASDSGLLGSGLKETLMTESRPAVVIPADNILNRIRVAGRGSKDIIVQWLLDTSDINQHIYVASVVGMGGIGKTILAKSVYNDDRITNHFDLHLWAHVTYEFDIERIIRSIILSCSAGSSSRINELELDQLKDVLISKISGKLFFLVLDDVWNESQEMWSNLESLLMKGARGSKILVTTRSQKVAKIVKSDAFTIQLDLLSEDEAHSLFLNEALGHQALPSLMPSYNDLPPPLKVCFAYCSLFPQDCEINVSDLLSLWMAQGYIEPQVSLDPEDVAEQNFQELYHRSFFMDIQMDDSGNIATCRMRDLIHNLARDVAGGWGTMTQSHTSDTTCLQKSYCLEDEPKLRSFLHQIVEQDEDDDPAGRITINDKLLLSRFKTLRVLDLHALCLEVLTDSIGNLVHLRYLDLSHNDALRKLPNSISNLHHLQALKLNFCHELGELPAGIGKLVCLRRLEIDECEKLTSMPPSLKNLSSLRTLSRFVVGRPRSQFTCGFEALGNLNRLRGRLMIDLSENWATSVDKAVKSKLSNKSRLTELRIKWGPTRSATKGGNIQYKKLLDGLQPPFGLTMLQIEGYRGQDFPSWASGNTLTTALPYLITVSIDGCGQCTALPPFSRLPHLRRLSLRFMDNVQFFESSDSLPSTSPSASPFFPSLQELTLHSFYSLEGWWKEKTRVLSASFSCLQKLKVWSCPKLTSMPLFPKIEVLDMQNINEKLLEVHNAWMTGSEVQSSSAHSEISNAEPGERPQSLLDLRTVQIKSCPHLKTLELVKNSKNLEKLVVERLDVLSSLTEVLKQLTSLEELEVAGCKDLDLLGKCQGSCNGCEECDVPWKFLSKLRRLSLRELPKLVTLPVGLKRVTSLQHLRLEGCPAVKMLPEGLKDIKSLVKVDIIECPQLMERCRDGGEDWHKVKHARVLHHKSWRYALMSETELSQKRKGKGENVVVHSEDPTIHVDVTVKRL